MTQTVWWLLWSACLVFIGWRDLRTHRIPKEGCLCLLLSGILGQAQDPARLAVSLRAAAALFLAGRLLYCIDRGQRLGAGDIRLTAASAVRLGGTGILAALLAGLLPALGAALLLRRKGIREIALGPYLAAGIFLVSLWRC